MIGADATTIGTEIERKFLLRQNDDGPDIGLSVVIGQTGTPLLQGYFRDIEGWSVRLRVAGGKAWLTLKSRDAAAQDSNMMRWEIESPVDPDLAGRLLGALAPERCIVKTRFSIPVAGTELHWEIDRFEGRHAGLWLAEIELPSADHPLDLPAWIGEEVTRDPRYSNANLAAQSDSPSDLPAPLPGDIDRMARRLLAAAGTGVAPPPDKPDRSAGRRAERALRQTRLERALRDNLLRRKQQSRGREREPGREPEGSAMPALDRDDPAQ